MKTIAFIYRIFLLSRYRVICKGKELLKQKSSKLIMPNHQAHVDAQILITILLKYIKITPMASARFFEIPVIKGIFKKLNAVPISNLQSGKIDKDAIDNALTLATKSLEEGGNILIYPSGQLAGQGFEKIFNKSGAYNIAANLPKEVKIIGVRISGLWGSRWSKAWSGDIPPIFSNLLWAFFYIMANLVFFVPKRKVYIDFEDITQDALKEAAKGKNEFNNYLENFYNGRNEEDVSFIKHFFYASKSKRKLPEKISGSLKELSASSTIDPNQIPDDILSSIGEMISRETGMPVKNISPDSNLVLDMGIDSIGLVNIIVSIEGKYNTIFTGDFAQLKTVGDICMIALGTVEQAEILKPSTLNHFIKEKTRVSTDPDKNILDNFITKCIENKNESFAYDKMMGSTSRKDFLLKALVVSKLIKKKVKEKYVGIMLPALESTTLLILATYLAKKIPVMLNWTVGPKMLLSTVDAANVQKIITASSFHHKISDQLPKELDSKFLFFDKEIKKVGLGTKLSSLLSSFFPKRLLTGDNPDETAVILFTSGSETVPKAVPLTHKNIVSNLWGVLDITEIFSHDILICFLPPFHSFGFTVLCVLPMITEIRAAYTPDPKDSREIAKILRHTKASVLLATPTFLKMIMNVASDEDFNSVRLAITGAESLHPIVAQQFKNKTDEVAVLLQGYGITECSPVLSITSAETEDLKSVGKFITGVDCHIIDLQNNAPLKNGNEGMIVVHGKSIFNGYLDKKIDSPFIAIEGKMFYKTGDLGYIDKNGDLFITGRLKRFIKIAGEMISLPAIENALLEKFGSEDELVLAVESDETGSIPQIVLFTKTKILIEEANEYLRKQGFSNLMKINKVHIIDEIPILGTGKTDYKKLKELTKELSPA